MTPAMSGLYWQHIRRAAWPVQSMTTHTRRGFLGHPGHSGKLFVCHIGWGPVLNTRAGSCVLRAGLIWLNCSTSETSDCFRSKSIYNTCMCRCSNLITIKGELIHRLTAY